MKNNFIEVTIDNKAYHLSCEGNQEHLKNIAEYIEDKIKNITLAIPSVPKNNNIFTIYVAANIADELLKERELRDMLVNEKFNESISKFHKNNPINENEENADIVKLIDENDSLNKKVEYLTETLEDLKLELSAKDADLNTVKETNENIISQRDVFKEKIALFNIETEKYKEKITTYHNENAFLKEQIKKSEQFVSQYPILSKNVQALTEENASLKHSLSEKTSLSEKLNAENASLKSSVDALSNEISALKSKSEDVEKCNAHIKELQNSLDAYINENNDLKSKVLELEQAKVQNSEFKNIISEYGETINSLNEKLKEVQEEKELISSNLANDNNARFLELEKENSELKQLLQLQKDENENTKQQLITAKSDLNIAKSRLGNLQVELNRYKNQPQQNNKKQKR